MNDNREMIVLNGEQIDELVRCKDCKYKDTDKCPLADICNWEWVTWSNADDYCSRGERKDEVTE